MNVEWHRRRSNGTSATYYLTRDHLGSGTAVMDANGASLVNLSFGALGSRRGAAWHDGPSTDDWTQITATTRRGFTGHEHLDNLSLIHMNGRAYDPKLGRFLSGDPVYVGNLADPQSLNPYSYAGNRPLSATDPTGYAAIGSLSETTVSAEFGLLGQLANLDQAISQYRAALGTWAAGCRAALGSCNDVAPDVSGILGAASGVVSAGNALQRQINDGELARHRQYDAESAWLSSREYSDLHKEWWEDIKDLSAGLSPAAMRRLDAMPISWQIMMADAGLYLGAGGDGAMGFSSARSSVGLLVIPGDGTASFIGGQSISGEALALGATKYGEITFVNTTKAEFLGATQTNIGLGRIGFTFYQGAVSGDLIGVGLALSRGYGYSRSGAYTNSIGKSFELFDVHEALSNLFYALDGN